MAEWIEILDTNGPMLVLLFFAVGSPFWLGNLRYHWLAINEPFERSTRGHSPLGPTEKILARKRGFLRQNGALSLYSVYVKRVVLTNQRVCVSYPYAARGYWLYTVPVEKIWQAVVFHVPAASFSPFRLRMDFAHTTNLQTLEIRFDTPSEILKWIAELESLGIKIRGEIPWPR